MKLVHRLLDYSRPWSLPHVALFTGNPIVKRNGAIVMGRGAAKQVRDTFPGIDRTFGAMIQRNPASNILWARLGNESRYIGWFKVKYHWELPAELALIAESAWELSELADRKPNMTFHMNYPGVGNGKLTEDEVITVLAPLPDNVVLYR